MPKTRFVIATYPRTGSNWLCGALNAHPSVLCHYEVLHPEQIHYERAYAEPRPRFMPSLADRDADPRAFIDGLFARDLGHEAVGVKLMHGQAPLLTCELLRDSSVRKIVLRRENRVRVFLSVKRARSGRFAPIELDPAELRAFCREYDEYFAWLDRHLVRQDVLRLSYERLFDPGEVARVLDFLGVAAVEESSLDAWHDWQNRDTLREAISNFDELERRLARTELAAELAAA